MIQLNQQSPIPIALGENVFDKASFKQLCDNKAAAILQPDILRCGGISGFVEIAQVIEPYQLPLCNHLLPELSASIISAFSNAHRLEYDDLLSPDLFVNSITIKAGGISMPPVPGTGISLTDYAIKNYQVK